MPTGLYNATDPWNIDFVHLCKTDTAMIRSDAPSHAKH